jgi:3-methyl-2-oxobutanoate hydroxymethyltransferase
MAETSKKNKKIRVTTFKEKARRGEKIAVLTAYDATIARILDRAGIDAVLVGDSLGMVIMGEDSTLPVTMDIMVHHTRAVARGVDRALVIADMPFLSYSVNVEQALLNAGRLMQEGGAEAVKLEGGHSPDVIRRLVDAGIPVMGHIGLLPQSVHQLGGYGMQGRSQPEAEKLVSEALSIEQAGAFAVVLESIPSALATRITTQLQIPTIGIGAGAGCAGQVLVSYDAFGLFDGFVPSFVKQYANLGQTMSEATRSYIDDVRAGRFPSSS